MFHVSGPSHLTCIDWSLAEHRGSITASLVQGVYLLERDRQKKRRGTSKARAPPWWEFFDFRLFKELIDQSDSSIYGAIFENGKYRNIPPSPQHNHHHQNDSYSAASRTQTAPRFIIAFRGTLLKFRTVLRDIELDVKYILNELTRDPRYGNTSQTVQGMVSVASGLGREGDVWLAGHSLGSAIALQIGKEMAKMGRYLETYLFNPPWTSVPLETLIKNQALKDGIRVVSSVCKVGLSKAARHVGRASSSHHQQQQMHGRRDDRGSFNGPLGNWMPYLFVNPNDPICAEYIGYFEHREKMEAMGLGRIGRAATQESTMCLLSEFMGRDGETSQLLPSAFVIKNMSPGNHNLNLTHGILQWYKSHPPSWHSTPYQFT